MSRVCEITGKRPMAGNNVSHSNRKTKRRFLLNLVNVRLHSNLLSSKISFRIAASTLRTINYNGDIDSFFLNIKNRKLTLSARKIRKKIVEAKKNKEGL